MKGRLPARGGPTVGAVAGLAFVLALAAGGARALESFAESPLVISSQGRDHAFVVEVAATPAQRAQGLMWRRNVAPDRGMLFLYGRETVIRMWMKNTLVPLDMLFIDRAGKIVKIHERAVPGSTGGISSGKKARAVLELSGGTASRLGIKAGDRVVHAAFGARRD